MTFDELDAIVRRDAVDIGAHTVSHPVLPLLGDDDARTEIGSSFRALRERWPTTLPWVAAPFGLYDARTSGLARDAGLQGILNLHAFSLAQTSAIHGLPRVNVMETAPPWKLALRLSRFADLIWSPPGGVVDYPPRPAPD
jgi:peptidoglycan/xylan/chitin deacetylase (PgdA/CDA1 family)